ncbi:unnamed protein product [Prorocentrum cordatum]|uniref:Uncharacterized protein n=1 Tax=Prorocentrum cordatum TaxID=2364126 RepID=A0ABN9TEQ5_9DINO|nr:unnamed protein product [Polarella glacialis]
MDYFQTMDYFSDGSVSKAITVSIPVRPDVPQARWLLGWFGTLEIFWAVAFETTLLGSMARAGLLSVAWMQGASGVGAKELVTELDVTCVTDRPTVESEHYMLMFACHCETILADEARELQGVVGCYH